MHGRLDLRSGFEGQGGLGLLNEEVMVSRLDWCRDVTDKVAGCSSFIPWLPNSGRSATCNGYDITPKARAEASDSHPATHLVLL
jgi:hypothetical protein